MDMQGSQTEAKTSVNQAKPKTRGGIPEQVTLYKLLKPRGNHLDAALQ